MGAILGLNAKFYRLTTGTRATWGAATGGLHTAAAPASLDEITNVKDLGFTSTHGEANVSVRGNNGYAALLPTLTTLELKWSQVYDPTDADLLALLAAHIGKTTLAMAALDGDKAVAGNIGIWADWYIFVGEKTENLEEGQMLNFTAKPGLTAVAPEWVKTA
jgi:hypothetical protein